MEGHGAGDLARAARRARSPTHPTFAVLLYRGGRPGTIPTPRASAFAEHGWGGSWVDGVFDFHHFHSTSHEVLAVVDGSATLELGGPQGEALKMSPGRRRRAAGAGRLRQLVQRGVEVGAERVGVGQRVGVAETPKRRSRAVTTPIETRGGRQRHRRVDLRRRQPTGSAAPPGPATLETVRLNSRGCANAWASARWTGPGVRASVRNAASTGSASPSRRRCAVAACTAREPRHGVGLVARQREEQERDPVAAAGVVLARAHVGRDHRLQPRGGSPRRSASGAGRPRRPRARRRSA